nr:hypothetical protein [uncultured Butyrivibrio sp.]
MNKKIKALIKVVLIGLVGLLVLDFLVGLFSSVTGVKSVTMRMNDHAAERVADHIAETPMPEGCEVVEKIALAGNIDSAGKLPFHYGAVLIKTDLSMEELEEHFRKYPYQGYIYEVEKQETQQLSEVHAASKLDRDYLLTDVSDGNYYLVSSYGSGIGIFGLLYDPRCSIG